MGMPEYNAPFFNALSAVFLSYKERHGENEALKFIHDIFSQRLKPVYDEWGFEKGNPHDFERVVKKNDELLGLHVSFRVEVNKIIYSFHTDPFPKLKCHVDGGVFDHTYMSVKVNHLLGDKWKYHTHKHLWEGDPYTEHVIVEGEK